MAGKIESLLDRLLDQLIIWLTPPPTHGIPLPPLSKEDIEKINARINDPLYDPGYIPESTDGTDF